MIKLSKVDRAMFKGFADRMNKALDADESDTELATALSSLRRPSPVKDDRPPRASYARPEMSRTLVDHTSKTVP